MREGWQIKKLGDLADLQRGLTYSKGDEVPFSSKCVLRSNNIDLESAKLDLTELKYLRDDFAIPDDRKVKKNSIFICMSNGSKQHVGKVAFIDTDIDYAFGGFMGLIVPKEGIAPKYVFYSCQSSAYRLFLSSIGNGIGITNLRFTDLANYSLPVPPIEEQEKIVAELDCLTSIIEKKKQQLEELDKLTQSIFYDMFGDPITNEKGWAIGSFGRIMTMAKVERCGEREGLPVLSITMRNGIVRQSERFKKVIASKDVSAYKVVPRGCLVIAFPIDEGLIYVQDVDDEGIMSPAYNVWAVNYAKVQKDYLVAYFHSAFAMKYYKDKLRGTTQRRRMLAKEDLLSMPIPLPPMAVQSLFAQKLEAIEKQKALVKRSIVETETLFNSRMDFWFNN